MTDIVQLVIKYSRPWFNAMRRNGRIEWDMPSQVEIRAQAQLLIDGLAKEGYEITARADVPQTGRDAIIEECAKICDDVAARAYRLMEDPKAARKVLAAVANGSMECAENIRSSSVTRPDCGTTNE